MVSHAGDGGPRAVVSLAAALLCVLLLRAPLRAVPSFARQTGMDCSACHTVFPELTPFGRRFKLTAYNVASVKWITAVDAQGNTRVRLSTVPPIAAMFQASHQFTAHNPLTYTAAGTDGAGTNSFPAQFSFFYAGSITPNIGALIQTTYDPASGYLHFDNSDIRYADETDLFDQDFIFGAMANNNPTVQDVWNSVPAWGFPYISPSGSQLVNPPAAPRIETLGGQVASLGAYCFWDDMVYLEVSDYRSADPLGTSYSLEGDTPYWRLATEYDWDNDSWEVGTFGMASQTYPTSAPIGLPRDSFTDVGLDSQYQYIGDNNIVTLHGTWIREADNWGASYVGTNPGSGTADVQYGNLEQIALNATYYFRRMFGATVGYFGTTGNQDAGLYGGGTAVYGSAANSPNDNGFIYELNFVPWYNTKFTLQYTAYNEFNGGVRNYDGYGRNAWDNNTTMLVGWFAY